MKFLHPVYPFIFSLVLVLQFGCSKQIHIKDLKINNTSNTLRKSISFITENKSSCYVEYWRKSTNKLQYSKVSKNSSAHDILIINLLEHEQYQFRIISSSNGKIYKSDTFSFETNRLPVSVPKYELVKKTYDFNGYILLKKYYDEGCFVLLDDSARVVWYQSFDTTTLRAFQWTKENRIVSLQDSTTIVEFDLSGKIVNNLDIDIGEPNTRIHHELFKNDSGDYVFLNYNYRYLDLSSIGGKRNDTIRTDGIMVINSEGDLKWKWSVFDVMNPLNDPDILKVKKDWGHANSISYSPDGNLIVSFRDFNQIWKINSSDGSVIWKLGENGDFEMDAAQQTIKQHSAHYVNPGEIMAFDNGNDQRGYSRVTSYFVDEENKELDNNISILLDKSMSTFRMGSAYFMDNDHILVCSPKKQLGLAIYDKEGEQVWKLTGKYDSYRAYYIPSEKVELKKPNF